jgi:hypothetical protein
MASLSTSVAEVVFTPPGNLLRTYTSNWPPSLYFGSPLSADCSQMLIFGGPLFVLLSIRVLVEEVLIFLLVLQSTQLHGCWSRRTVSTRLKVDTVSPVGVTDQLLQGVASFSGHQLLEITADSRLEASNVLVDRLLLRHRGDLYLQVQELLGEVLDRGQLSDIGDSVSGGAHGVDELPPRLNCSSKVGPSHGRNIS